MLAAHHATRGLQQGCCDLFRRQRHQGNGKDRRHVEKSLNLVGGISVQLSVKALNKLVTSDGLIITPDAKVKTSGDTSSKQLWPYESGNAALWQNDDNFRSHMPAIAVVDSGIAARAGFGNRVIASVNLSTLPNNSPGDGRGHGTFVAGIAADSTTDYAGAAPQANLVSVDVMDDTGTGSTSDIIAACQWILDHKAQYNIRVANFSLHSSIMAPFYYDPLDKAVEKLWFNGITVVTAAGNYGHDRPPGDVKFSPGNDPFVITVGAADLNGTVKTSDDTIAPWSAWGHTMDGFAKPELSAPGRYMVGPVPETARRFPPTGQRRRARLHAALGHLVRGPGRLRRGGADHRPASGVDTRTRSRAR